MCTLASLPTIATLIVFWQGTIRGPVVQSLHDKVLHFLAFGGLSLLCVPLVSALGAVHGLSRRVQIGLCASYATLVGGLLEVVQALLPYRSAEWLDVMADTAGAFVASTLIWILFPSLRRLQSKG